MQIRPRIVSREFKSGRSASSIGGVEVHTLDRKQTTRKPFSIMHIDVARAYFHAKGSETCAGTIASGGQNGR